ncbi:hypothetical protein OCU04_010230 [Sclerotinia nivalis]|uniref:Uncharacterized protein n=1 Tax=Sclerotinia nivalis TaxID=352851 RepID=A0A9X0DG28_9HELO|nr:hypothetical protein OCU04_010230 [Sclerotinia nivalis]
MARTRKIPIPQTTTWTKFHLPASQPLPTIHDIESDGQSTPFAQILIILAEACGSSYHLAVGRNAEEPERGTCCWLEPRNTPGHFYGVSFIHSVLRFFSQERYSRK